jgi:hypothetical protein
MGTRCRGLPEWFSLGNLRFCLLGVLKVYHGSTTLFIGATGNTGRNFVRHLPDLIVSGHTNYRILGLTRSLNSSTSMKLAKLPRIEM